MPTYRAPDGTELAYHLAGAGDPLICLPGGPMQDAWYLSDLGGLSERRQLVLADPRGTGASGVPADPASYRCDRQVDDVEALRTHLGLDRLDLLGHSAGTNLAVSYAARYPDRVGRLVLITPSAMAFGIDTPAAARLEVARLRSDEPWFEPAFAALSALVNGEADAGAVAAVEPLRHGRWDAATREWVAAQDEHRNAEAVGAFLADGAFDPSATRAALATVDAPVLVLAGEVDLNTPPSVAAEVAAVFAAADLVVQPGAGHSPWRDDPARFVDVVASFLE